MISVITAAYNSENTIEDTLRSVLDQTLNNFEYVIIDGGSTDRTEEIVMSYKEAFEKKGVILTYQSEKDNGIYDAWNKGIKLSSGEFIGFLGSDDRYYPNALNQYQNIIRSNPDLDYISSKVKVVNKGKTIKTITDSWKWKTFRNYMNVAHVGSLHSRSYFEKNGLFNTAYRIAGDYELLLRAGKDLKYEFLDEFTAEMDADGVSNKLIRLTLLETKKAKIETAGLDPMICSLYYFWALFKGKMRRFI